LLPPLGGISNTFRITSSNRPEPHYFAGTRNQQPAEPVSCFKGVRTLLYGNGSLFAPDIVKIPPSLKSGSLDVLMGFLGLVLLMVLDFGTKIKFDLRWCALATKKSQGKAE